MVSVVLAVVMMQRALVTRVLDATAVEVVEHALVLDLLRDVTGAVAGLTLHVMGEGGFCRGGQVGQQDIVFQCVFFSSIGFGCHIDFRNMRFCCCIGFRLNLIVLGDQRAQRGEHLCIAKIIGFSRRFEPVVSRTSDTTPRTRRGPSGTAT